MSQPSFPASKLYAISQGRDCKGDDICHWCGAACERRWTHDDAVPAPHVRGMKTTARYPGRPYICVGCWLWRRKRLTINSLDGNFIDGKHPPQWSWFLTNDGAWYIRQGDSTLYEKLLKPPCRFALMILDGTNGQINHLHLANANDIAEITPETPLHFTINGIQHRYTIHELSRGICYGGDGREPGVQALLRFLGPAKKELIDKWKEPAQRQGSGRQPEPPAATNLKKPVVKSGTT